MARKKCKKTRSTQISVSIPSHLIDGLDKLAKADNRNRSNYITNLIYQVVITSLDTRLLPLIAERKK